MPYFVQSIILDAFLQVLNMSLTASIIIIFVLVARLLLKKAPKIFSYALWSIVFFRLLCPISFESMFSLLPINANPISTNTIYSETPQISTGITTVDNVINPILPAPANGANDDNPLLIAATIGESLWIMGIVVLLIYSIVSLLRLRKKLIGAVKLRDNIFLADYIVSPFVIGLFRPQIYLPSTLTEREQSYIILHEQTHIRRFDHIIKIVAFTALCIHWFNPLVWIAFTLTIKDMEMSCDESVMKRLDTNIREEYSASLLSLATGRKIIAGTPLAFGEGDTKSRIKNVLHYKKPALWVMLTALIVVSAICIAFASNPLRASHDAGQVVGEYEDIDKLVGEFIHSGIEAYTIGVNKYGAPIFTNPDAAFEQAQKDYSDGFAAIANEFDLDAVSKNNYDWYKTYGWQLSAKDEAIQKQGIAISQFFDIYENSFTTNSPTKHNPTKESGDSSTIESIAQEFIDNEILNYEQIGVEIIDSKILSLKLFNWPGFDNLADRAVYVYLLEYRLLPKDLGKSQLSLSGGMRIDEEGWITEWSSMGQPLIVVFEAEGKEDLIGFLWSAEISEKDGGLEAAVKALLEKNGANLSFEENPDTPNASIPSIMINDVLYYMSAGKALSIRG